MYDNTQYSKIFDESSVKSEGLTTPSVSSITDEIKDFTGVSIDVFTMR
jgi:hypothetical protein